MSNFYEANGVIAWEHQESNWPSWLGVADQEFKHYKLTFSAGADGTVSVGVCAAWSDRLDDPLANFTSEITGCTWLGRDDMLAISDDGLLTVMRREKAAAFVDFRSGFTLQLPREFVEPVRLVIVKAWEMAAARAALKAAASDA